MFWSSTGILLNNKARSWSKVAIGLLECCRTPRILQLFVCNCNKWSRFLKRHCNQDIDVLQNSRKVRRSLCGSCRLVIVVTPRWTCWSPAFDPCLSGVVPYADVSRTSQSALWRYFVAMHPAVSPLWSIYLVFCSQQCCFGFLRSSPHLVVIPKMILLLVQVDLVNHFANLLLEQHAVLESRFPFDKADPWSSCISLCRQCVAENNCVWSCLIKLQSSLLSELQIAPKYCVLKSVSKYFCMARFLLTTSRIGFPQSHLDYPSDSQ